MNNVTQTASPSFLESPTGRAWRRLKARWPAMVGLLLIVCLVVLAVFAHEIAPYDVIKQTYLLVRKAPSHWFGTDEVGRDILTRVIWGARASLSAGVISVAIAISIGVPLELIAGYRGGVIDALISRFTDAMLACPFLILAIALAAFLGPSLGNAMIAIGITATPLFVRLTRGQTLAIRTEDYIEAARAVGNPVCASPYPAQCVAGIAGASHLDHCDRDYCRSQPVLFGARATTADAVMGVDVECRPALFGQCTVDGGMAGSGYFCFGDFIQSSGRRAARCFGSAQPLTRFNRRRSVSRGQCL